MQNLVIFGDSASLITTLLMDATLKEAQRRGDVRVAAFCDAGRGAREPPLLFSVARTLVGAAVRRLLINPSDPALTPRQRLWLKHPCRSSPRRLARLHRIPILRPPNSGINSRRFINELRSVAGPAIALSYACPRIFGGELLGNFRAAANYHNSLLPRYAGLAATSWSIWYGEAVSGFTFHHMDEGIDAGNILIQDSVPLTGKSGVLDVEYEKTALAAGRIGELLDMLLAGDPGLPQTGERSYFSIRDYEEFRAIRDPGGHTYAELRRRLRAFRVLSFRFGGHSYPVSRIVRANGGGLGRSPMVFRTRDGVIARASRFMDMPLPLFLVWNLVRRLRPRAFS
jgi:methionyl-tRNA formyltransferase